MEDAFFSQLDGNAVRELLLRTELRHAALFAVSDTLRIERCSDAAQQLSGPIGIMRVSGEVASMGGIGPLVSLVAILSVSIGLINLFPIPVLDGGHFLFFLIEGVLRRPLPLRAPRYRVLFLFGSIERRSPMPRPGMLPPPLNGRLVRCQVSPLSAERSTAAFWLVQSLV